MERPKIKDYYRKDATLNEVSESYNKAPELFKYAQAVDRYADALEDSLVKDGETLTLMNAEIKGLKAELSERQTPDKSNDSGQQEALNMHVVIARFSGNERMKLQKHFTELYGNAPMAKEKANSFAVGFGKACDMIIDALNAL